MQNNNQKGLSVNRTNDFEVSLTSKYVQDSAPPHEEGVGSGGGKIQMTSQDTCIREKWPWLLNQAFFQKQPFHLPYCEVSTSGHKPIHNLWEYVIFSRCKSVIWHSVLLSLWNEETVFLPVAFQVVTASNPTTENVSKCFVPGHRYVKNGL